VAERAPLDRWVLARLNETVRVMRDRLDDYDAQGTTRAAESFVVDDLSNWYIRRSRPRFWRSSKEGRDPDKTAAQSTLYEALLTLARALAPLIPFVTEEMYLNLARGAGDDAPASVHLCDYPAYDEALARDTADLVRDMAAVVRVVELGRAARTEAGVRVRQPLPRILVHAPSEADFAALLRHREQILDELNVKEVAPMARPEEYIAYEIRPNLPLIGRKYGKRVPAIRAALAAADAGELARRVAAGEKVTLTLDGGEAVTLAPEEVLVDTRQRGGFAVAEDAGYVVALDTALTPELVHEGLARDFVRVVQEARKNAGLEIADRIRVNYAVPADAEPAVAAFTDFIKAETLAREIVAGDLDASAYQETFDRALGGEPVTVGVTRVG
jgi:isoleucyl-tRNA synthetase